MTAAGRDAAPDSAGARLELAEALLGCDDAALSAQRAVEWLGERSGAAPIVCAVVDAAKGRLVGLAGHRAGGPVRELFAALDDREDFLVAALGGDRPALLGPRTGVHARSHLRAPFRGGALVSFPMRARSRPGAPAEAVGVLLTPALGARAAEDAAWLASVLATQLEWIGALPPRRPETGPRPILGARPASPPPPASGVKAQFLAGASHELRTPLNAILGYTSMLLQGMGGELDPAQRRMLGKVDANGRHLLALVNDMLDIARLETGRMPLAPVCFDVPALCAEVLAELGPTAPGARLAIGVEAAPGLPELYGDRGKVKQILENLFANALKFTREGSITLRCSYSQASRRFSMAVADTGVGIAAEDQARLFDDFSQAGHPAGTTFGGTGLGLSIAARLAQRMGGALSLESEPGRGSTFTLEIGDLPAPPREITTPPPRAADAG